MSAATRGTLYDDIKAKGGKPIMWKAGHSLIKAKMKEEHAELAGEMSGHIFFAHRWLGFDDAIYTGARVLEMLSRGDTKLADLAAKLPVMINTPEIRIDCPDDRKACLSPEARSWNACASAQAKSCGSGWLADDCGNCFLVCATTSGCPRGMSCNAQKYCESLSRCMAASKSH